jgi:hypothetical protein
MASIIPRAIVHSIGSTQGVVARTRACFLLLPALDFEIRRWYGILAELVVVCVPFRIRKVAAPEGRLFEAFHSGGSEHRMPAHNVGLLAFFAFASTGLSKA